MGGHMEAERGSAPRSHMAVSRHAQHVEAQHCSSSANSDAASTYDTIECLYLMSDVRMQERTYEHVQLVDKRQIKKMAIVEIQVRSHITRFMLDSGATCNIVCVSEYEKMKHKPSLLSSNVDVFT
ncbi:hypothetical protein NDU88_006382 [Pleurodeles waltl]|uniref:Uncharacterized protein n=1 Tax=Pleurodeles waltl TaxID=8319 RepID=A0AAV7MFP8_PLEWA|nr:hypothetical protein NDU88_006382 [Pleurodeles waltl]